MSEFFGTCILHVLCFWRSPVIHLPLFWVWHWSFHNKKAKASCLNIFIAMQGPMNVIIWSFYSFYQLLILRLFKMTVTLLCHKYSSNCGVRVVWNLMKTHSLGRCIIYCEIILVNLISKEPIMFNMYTKFKWI